MSITFTRLTVRSLILPAVLTLAALAVLVSLGNWQVRRLAWKEDLIARAHERPQAEPLDFRGGDLAAIDDVAAFVGENEYRRMRLAGEYSPDGEVRVFTSLERPRGAYGGPGYWVLTPFVTPPGGRILVNRGFVPEGLMDEYAPPPEGAQEIAGLIRAPETGNWATPEPDLEHRIFYSRDPARIAAATGVSGLAGGAEPAPFFIDLDDAYTPAGGLPQAGETRMSFTNNHLQYAVTWYGLAAVLLAVFAGFVWRRLKEPQPERLTPPGRHP